MKRRIIADNVPIRLRPQDMNDPKDVNFLRMRDEEQKKLDDARAAEAARKAHEEAVERNKQLFNKLDAAEDPQAKFDVLFDELVPGQGKADTFAGEIVRAFGRMQYRWYNDGDVFFLGYGFETAGGAAQFLQNAGLDVFSFIDTDNGVDPYGISEKKLDSSYDAFLIELRQAVIDEVTNNVELLEQPNEDDCNKTETDELEDILPTFECDWDLNQLCPAVVYHIDQGNLSSRDVASEIEFWDSLRNATVDVSYGELYVSDMDYETYYNLVVERSMERDLEYYNDEVISEYGDPDDMEEEDEDYEEDNEDYSEEE